MITQTFTFRNFLGVERTETHYFHISKSDVLLSDEGVYNTIIEAGKELESRVEKIQAIENKEPITPTDGGFDEESMFMMDTTRLMAQLLDMVIGLSYGVLSDDGDSFIKNKEIVDKFKNSKAYDYMLSRFMENPEELTTFVTEVMGS